MPCEAELVRGWDDALFDALGTAARERHSSRVAVVAPLVDDGAPPPPQGAFPRVGRLWGDARLPFIDAARFVRARTVPQPAAWWASNAVTAAPSAAWRDGGSGGGPWAPYDAALRALPPFAHDALLTAAAAAARWALVSPTATLATVLPGAALPTPESAAAAWALPPLAAAAALSTLHTLLSGPPHADALGARGLALGMSDDGDACHVDAHPCAALGVLGAAGAVPSAEELLVKFGSEAAYGAAVAHIGAALAAATQARHIEAQRARMAPSTSARWAGGGSSGAGGAALPRTASSRTMLPSSLQRAPSRRQVAWKE